MSVPRSVVVGLHDDPHITQLIGELSLCSERLRTLWAKHDVRVREGGVTKLQHPLIGPLDLQYQEFALPESQHLLVTYHAEPGSPSEHAFRMLADLANEQPVTQL